METTAKELETANKLEFDTPVKEVVVTAEIEGHAVVTEV